MGRKSKQEKDLQAYWDKKLQKMGLGVDRGTSRKLLYIGGNKALEIVENDPRDMTRPEAGKISKSLTNISPTPCVSYGPLGPKKAPKRTT